MAVGGVAAQADVGDHHQLGDLFFELPHRLLHRALGGGGFGAGVVFPAGQPEEEDRGHPHVQGGFGLATSRSGDRRETPGMEGTSWRTRLPGAANMG